ncbi:MAG: DUF2092 domain-containing protein [Verrucomicrobiales bacterium]
MRPFLLITTTTLALGLPAAFAEIDPKADAALRAMSDQLGKAKQLTVKAKRTVVPELLENKAAIGDATIESAVHRPDKLKAVVTGTDKERQFFLGKDGSVIYSKENKFYARFPGKPTIDESFDSAQVEFGMYVPVQDLLSQNPYKDLIARAKSGKHVGVEAVAGEDCDHLAFTQEGIDWEIWIAKSDQLPRKFVIDVKAIEGKSDFVVQDIEWNLDPGLKDGDFTFSPPEGSTEIEFLPQDEEEAAAEEKK